VTTVGYARVSTPEQSLDPQLDRLRAEGCDRIFDDFASAARASRPGWDRCREYLREGDVLVAVKLDRLGRSVQHLAALVEDLAERGVGLKILDQGIDTTTAAGRMLLHMLAAIAEFERALISERTRDGLAAAAAKGRKGGRRRVLTEQDVERARELYAASSMTVDEIARAVGSSTTTLYRALGKVGPKGLGEGRPRGRAGGRKPGLTEAQVKQLRRLYDQRELTVREIGRQFGVAPATVYRYLKVG